MFRAAAADLFFPQVVLCNNNFIQATFLEEYDVTEHANLMIKYYFKGSPDPITEKQKDIINEIEVSSEGFFFFFKVSFRCVFLSTRKRLWPVVWLDPSCVSATPPA